MILCSASLLETSTNAFPSEGSGNNRHGASYHTSGHPLHSQTKIVLRPHVVFCGFLDYLTSSNGFLSSVIHRHCALLPVYGGGNTSSHVVFLVRRNTFAQQLYFNPSKIDIRLGRFCQFRLTTAIGERRKILWHTVLSLEKENSRIRGQKCRV